ncbi:putative T7SS-secreted protein [Saccharopolyspora shandongensis]|uniref:putative T7SS-secreted protein n=1 Tax=Saccharopolyspora shandongensis TaxID=418495 RepID=UPI0033DCE635
MAPDPREEVPGELPAIDETLATMTKLGTAFENAAQGFQKINTAGWEGPTADAFRDYYQQEPPKWFRAADAFTESADALRQYREVLAWAQRQAEQACADIERADRQTAQAEARYEQAADQGNATEPFQDPGAAARNQAQASLDAAKEQVEEAAKRAAAALIKASEKAPPQPGPLTMLASGVGDVFQNVAESYGDFWKGSFDGALDMLQQARTLNPFDPYNMMHPQQYGENISQLAASTVAAGKAFISDPIGTGKAMIGAGIDSFTKDPSGFVGRLAPEVAAGLATSGSSTAGSLGRRALDALADTRIGSRVNDAVDNIKGVPDPGHTPSHGQPPSPQHPNSPGMPPHDSTPANYGHQSPPTPSAVEPPSHQSSFDRPGPAEYTLPTAPDHNFDPQRPGHEQPTSQAEPAAHTPGRPPAAWEDYRPGDEAFDLARDPYGSPTTPHPSAAEPPGPAPQNHIRDDQDHPLNYDFRKVSADPDHGLPGNSGHWPSETDVPRAPSPDAGIDSDTTSQPDVDAPQHPRVSPLEDIQQHLDDTALDPVSASDLPDNAVWRTTTEPLFRCDNRDWDDIFGDGFASWGNDNDLHAHLSGSKESGYVSMTNDPEYYRQSNKDFLYEIEVDGGVDMNKSLGEHKWEWESEIDAYGGVRPERIKGRWELHRGDDGATYRTNWVDNPNYVPLR